LIGFKFLSFPSGSRPRAEPPPEIRAGTHASAVIVCVSRGLRHALFSYPVAR
jgi:hypothetical protein